MLKKRSLIKSAKMLTSGSKKIQSSKSQENFICRKKCWLGKL